MQCYFHFDVSHFWFFHVHKIRLPSVHWPLTVNSLPVYPHNCAYMSRPASKTKQKYLESPLHRNQIDTAILTVCHRDLNPTGQIFGLVFPACRQVNHSSGRLLLLFTLKSSFLESIVSKTIFLMFWYRLAPSFLVDDFATCWWSITGVQDKISLHTSTLKFIFRKALPITFISFSPTTKPHSTSLWQRKQELSRRISLPCAVLSRIYPFTECFYKGMWQPARLIMSLDCCQALIECFSK